MEAVTFIAEGATDLASSIAATMFLGCCAASLRAQGNYEVQVYGSELVPKGVTMVEIHSNFTASGTKGVVDGVLPTNHAVHETLEITHGFNEWFETGFYQFTSIQPDGSWKWVGTHIRPRFAVPERYKLPVGAEPVDRVRLSAAQLLAGHMDLGDPPDRRQEDRQALPGASIRRWRSRFTGPAATPGTSFRRM